MKSNVYDTTPPLTLEEWKPLVDGGDYVTPEQAAKLLKLKHAAAFNQVRRDFRKQLKPFYRVRVLNGGVDFLYATADVKAFAKEYKKLPKTRPRHNVSNAVSSDLISTREIVQQYNLRDEIDWRDLCRAYAPDHPKIIMTAGYLNYYSKFDVQRFFNAHKPHDTKETFNNFMALQFITGQSKPKTHRYGRPEL